MSKVILLKTCINAPIEICFDCSRSIDLHKESMAASDEQAIAGKTSGLIMLSESVTWRARHFGINFKMETKITSFNAPLSFTDEMIAGPFKLLKHAHIFESKSDHTLMTDVFMFKAPFGLIGKLVEHLFLAHYMTALLTKRNTALKKAAEQFSLASITDGRFEIDPGILKIPYDNHY